MSNFLGKAVDFYKSGVKATVSAGLDIARDHLLPKQDISEENLISDECGTDFAGHTGVVNTLAISGDGETLFSAGKDKKIRMWHTRTGKSAGIVGDQKSEVNEIILDNEVLYSCDVAGSIMKWNWRAAKDAFADDSGDSPPAPKAMARKESAHKDDVNGIALNPADKGKLFSCSKEIKMWNAASFQLLAEFEGTGTALDKFFCVAVSHDGSLLAGGTLSNVILLYQISRPKEKVALEGHTNAVMKVRFGPADSPVAPFLFSCSKDMNLRRWNVAARQCDKVYKGNAVRSQDGGKSVKSPLSASGKRGHSNEVLDFAFSHDARFICAVGHKGILLTDRDQTKLWDVQSGNCLYNYKGHAQNVHAVVASRDGQRFYTAGNDSMIKAWLGSPDITCAVHQRDRKKTEYRVRLFGQTLPPPVRAVKLADDYYRFKPFGSDGWGFLDAPITADTPPDYCVEFTCQLPTDPPRAAFVRLYPKADRAVIAAIRDEIERYTTLSHEGIVTCLSGLETRPLVISTQQKAAVIQLDCPKFCTAFCVRKHIDDANIYDSPEKKLPARKLLSVFKHMASVVQLLHDKGYIHTDITSKSFRYFPENPQNTALYASDAVGQVRLSGLQHVITFAKTSGRSIRNEDYSIPASFLSSTCGSNVTQDHAVWSLFVVFAEMETGLPAREIKKLAENRSLAFLSLHCRSEFYRAFQAAFDPCPATRCRDLRVLMRAMDEAADPVFQWEAYDAGRDKFVTMPVHTSFLLESAFASQTQPGHIVTFAPGSRSLCEASVDIRDVMRKFNGLGSCDFRGHLDLVQTIRRRLLPGAKLVVWQEEQSDGQWIQCHPAQSAWLASQSPAAVEKKYRSFEISGDHVDEASVEHLQETHPDWIRLQQRLVSCGMVEFDIVDLKRVTNPTTRRKYVQRRRLLAEKCNGGPNEREVFHLTTPHLLDTITKGDQGFENRLSKWAECGRGAYFAGNPMYSYVYKFYLWWGQEEPKVGEYHPVIKQKWDGELTLLVADVALGECKDFGYGSQSCPNDDFEAWCEESANRAQCGKAVAEDKRLTPSRPPILQPPDHPAGKRHFEDLHSSFSGENLNLYDTITSTEGDLNTHPNSRARVPDCCNEVTSWATVQEEGGPVGALPAANQLVRSHLHPRISNQTDGRRFGEQFVLFDTANSCPRFIMTIKKTSRSTGFEAASAPKPQPPVAAAARASRVLQVTAPVSGKVVKVVAVEGQLVEKGKTVLLEVEYAVADDVAAPASGGSAGAPP